SVSVTIKAQNRHGQAMKLKASDWLARIFQHEIDHLNGVLFTDRTTDIYKLEDLLEEQADDEAEGEASPPPVMG
ncbi:MAG TPA: peptide deformylase, partial [Anaerolineales bacterium]|nr:peptide deformylase [Anaerolineales bacterium]